MDERNVLKTRTSFPLIGSLGNFDFEFFPLDVVKKKVLETFKWYLRRVNKSSRSFSCSPDISVFVESGQIDLGKSSVRSKTDADGGKKESQQRFRFRWKYKSNSVLLLLFSDKKLSEKLKLFYTFEYKQSFPLKMTQTKSHFQN